VRAQPCPKADTPPTHHPPWCTCQGKKEEERIPDRLGKLPVAQLNQALDLFDLPRGAGDESKKVCGRVWRALPLCGVRRGLLPLLLRATRLCGGWGLPFCLPGVHG